MPTDLELNKNDDVFTDDTNDLSLISGRGNLEQSIRINAGDAISRFIGTKVTGQKIGLMEQRLTEALEDDPQVTNVENVTIEEVNRQSNSIKISATIDGREDVPLEVSP